VWEASGQEGPGKSDLFDVVGGGSEEALAGHGKQTSEASLAMAVELLGVGKRSFQGLLAALVDSLAHGVSRWASVRSRASVQTWRMIRRVALRFDVHEASSEQVLQIAGA